MRDQEPCAGQLSLSRMLLHAEELRARYPASQFAVCSSKNDLTSECP